MRDQLDHLKLTSDNELDFSVPYDRELARLTGDRPVASFELETAEQRPRGWWGRRLPPPPPLLHFAAVTGPTTGGP